MGDFKINLLNFESHPDTETFINTLGSYSFQPQILKPTRITEHTATLIDHIYFNSLQHHLVSGNILCDLTDHLPNFLIINRYSILPSNFKIYKRDYSKCNEQMLVKEFSNINWDKVLPTYGANVNDIFESFYLETTNIINKHAPLRKVTRSEIKIMSKTWITKAIKGSIKTKKKLFHKYLRTKNTYHHSKYKANRNKLNHIIKVSKIIYYDNYFTKNTNNNKNMWKGIKHLITLKPKGLNLPTKILKYDHVLKDSVSIASAFNDYFSNIDKNLANDIPSTSKSPIDYLGASQANTFFLFPVTSKEIEISNLNETKATGPFSIPTKLLKLLKVCLSKPLEILYNYSFSNGLVPDQFKLARVIPIHKKGPQTLMNNHRPISLLSVFNRIMEKLMYRRLISYIEKYNIIYDKQFGFRANYSTTQANMLITRAEGAES